MGTEPTQYLNFMKEEASRAYVSAVAAAVGCQFRPWPVPDLAGADATVSWFGDRKTAVDLQLKATASPVWLADGSALVIRMRRKTLVKLVDPVAICPAVLVAMVLPPDPDDWVTVTQQALTLRNAAYWTWLTGLDAVGESADASIRVPRANLFDPDALRGMLATANAFADVTRARLP